MQLSDPRHRTWTAFAAGAVVMLALVLVWLAWSRTQATVTHLVRGDFALSERPSLPLPGYPPPEGPRPPRLPLPGAP